jgi:hypothetical protein
MSAVHSWKSIKNKWTIKEDNQNFYGPSQEWVTSKWLFLALLLLWLVSHQWL